MIESGEVIENFTTFMSGYKKTLREEFILAKDGARQVHYHRCQKSFIPLELVASGCMSFIAPCQLDSRRVDEIIQEYISERHLVVRR